MTEAKTLEIVNEADGNGQKEVSVKIQDKKGPSIMDDEEMARIEEGYASGAKGLQITEVIYDIFAEALVEILADWHARNNGTYQ